MADLKKFLKWQKEHPNFMTPNVVDLKKSVSGNVIELSQEKDSQ